MPAEKPSSDVSAAERVKGRIRRWERGEIGDLWHEAIKGKQNRQRSLQRSTRRQQEARPDPDRCPQSQLNAARCNRLLQQGQYARAAQALVSKGLDHHSALARQAMQTKHPQGPLSTPPQGSPPSPHIHLSASQLSSGFLSFKAGSAPGPSGLRAEHLKAMITSRTPSRAVRGLNALTIFTNNLLAGKLPSSIAPYFCGARLFAANKKDSGHRPVAVGNILRRLASKCAAFSLSERAASLLSPLQLGVGIRGGCEAIVHAIRGILNDDRIPPSEKWLLQVDLENAFNNVERSAVFEDIRRLLPEIAAWVESSYGVRAELIFADLVILSCKGWHQGDPLAGLLFAIGALPILKKIAKQIPDLKANIWFHDDGAIIGTKDQLRQAHAIITSDGPARGLFLSNRKSLVHCKDLHASVTDLLDLGIPRADPRGVKHLGAAIGNHSLCTEILTSRIDKVAEIVDDLPLLQDPHHEATLLRSCFSIGKVSYAFRTGDPTEHITSLQRFDGVIRSALGGILGAALSDTQWLQASLPVSLGGMGL